jgi:DNA-binding transcriptional regulator GbsR (MarR family)
MAKMKAQKASQDGTDEALAEIRDRVIDALGEVASSWGYNEVIGRMYGTMFFSDAPLGLDDIADRLGISKATVSLNIPTLENLHMIRRVWRKGERKRFYEAERDFSRIIGTMINTIIRQEVSVVSMVANQTMEDLDRVMASSRGPVREAAERDKKRMENVAKFVALAQGLMDMVKAMTDEPGNGRDGRNGRSHAGGGSHGT